MGNDRRLVQGCIPARAEQAFPVAMKTVRVVKRLKRS